MDSKDLTDGMKDMAEELFGTVKDKLKESADEVIADLQSKAGGKIDELKDSLTENVAEKAKGLFSKE